jgi:enediyne biosynthesis protein E4
MGVAYDSFGNVLGSMGVESADWNHDGWLDLYVTPYQRQLAPLFQNQKGK